MTAIDFPATTKVILHLEGGDLVARGQAGRNEGRLSFSEGEAPKIEQGEGLTRIRARRLLSLNLPAEVEFELRGAPADVVLRNLGAVSMEGCSGDLVASELASLHVEEAARGDVALRKIEGVARLSRVGADLAAAHVQALSIDEVQGDASMTNVDRVDVALVGGDLSVTTAETVQVKNINGDAAFSSVSETITLKRVGGDLSVTSPGQSLAATEVKGDVDLRGPLQVGGKYWINAGGSVNARISGNVRLGARAEGEVLVGPEITLEQEADGRMTGVLGVAEDAADLNIEAGGAVLINSPRRTYRQHNVRVEQEVRQAMREVQQELRRAAASVSDEVLRTTRNLAGEWSSAENSENLGASVRDIVRDLLDSLDPRAPSRQTKSAPPPNRDEVRMILEMLANGAITSEEAERLLDALKT